MWDLDGALKSLNKNEQAIFAVCNRIKSAPDEDFLRWYPSPHGVQVSYSDGCLRLVAPPAFPRENNNCWSVIEQMLLWQRWFRLKGSQKIRDYPVNQRFLAKITHHSKTELPFIPNTLESHSYLNGLTGILWADDNMSIYDYSVGVEPVNNGPEYCEIIVSRLPALEPGQGLLNTSLPYSAEVETVSDGVISEFLPKLENLTFEQIFSLYHALLAKDWAIRQRVSYESLRYFNPLRRQRKAKTKPYADLIKSKGFSVSMDTAKDSVFLSIDVPLRNREEYASDVFLEYFYMFLRERKDIIQHLQAQKQRLSIYQKSPTPDGDNTPFECISQLLIQEFHIPIISPVEILYKPEAKVKTSMILTPAL